MARPGIGNATFANLTQEVSSSSALAVGLLFAEMLVSDRRKRPAETPA